MPSTNMTAGIGPMTNRIVSIADGNWSTTLGTKLARLRNAPAKAAARATPILEKKVHMP